jgi:hypothetical protein
VTQASGSVQCVPMKGRSGCRRNQELVAIRVLLIRMPRILRDLLADVLGSESDIQIVADVLSPRDVTTDDLARMQPDVVIVGPDAKEPARTCLEMLGRTPRLKLLALERKGREFSIYELRPVRTKLGALSPTTLIASIRNALRPMPLSTREIEEGDVADTGREDRVPSVSIVRERARR